MSAQQPIYRYTIRRTDGTETTADAMNYRDVDEWLVFDDTRSSVLTIRREKVDEIARSAEPVGAQLVDELTDTAPEKGAPDDQHPTQAELNTIARGHFAALEASYAALREAARPRPVVPCERVVNRDEIEA